MIFLTGGKICIMLQIIEKTQYALIYMLYKTKYYKSGKGYIFRANQILAFIIAMTALVFFLLLSNEKLKSYTTLVFFGSILLATFLVLEKNTAKQKMIYHRSTYYNRKKYIIPFYIYSGIVLMLFALIGYFKVQ